MLPESDNSSLAILLVGGSFDLATGRPSGYFRKFAQAVSGGAPIPTEIVNGGNYRDLVDLLARTRHVTHLFWFADIPNDLPKLLPGLRVRFPGLILVQSKNNRAPREYTRAQLVDRMRASRSAFLLEFTSASTGEVLATLLTPCGEALFEGEADVCRVAKEIVCHVLARPASVKP